MVNEKLVNNFNESTETSIYDLYSIIQAVNTSKNLISAYMECYQPALPKCQ